MTLSYRVWQLTQQEVTAGIGLADMLVCELPPRPVPEPELPDGSVEPDEEISRLELWAFGLLPPAEEVQVTTEVITGISRHEQLARYFGAR